MSDSLWYVFGFASGDVWTVAVYHWADTVLREFLVGRAPGETSGP